MPKTEQDYPLAHASAREVTEAARAVMRDCVIARRIGGTARMIGEFTFVRERDRERESRNERLTKLHKTGGDDRLVVNVAGFDPRVTCYTAMSAPIESCQYIMQEMLKTEYRETFGHAPNPSIRVALPLTLKARKSFCHVCRKCGPKKIQRERERSGLTDILTTEIADGKCQVYIETRSRTIWARWYDIWEAVEATVAVCVRRGRWGWSSVTSESNESHSFTYLTTYQSILHASYVKLIGYVPIKSFGWIGLVWFGLAWLGSLTDCDFPLSDTARPMPMVQDLFVVVTDEPWPPLQLLSLGVGNLTNGSTAVRNQDR